jgi:hypothetical protein
MTFRNNRFPIFGFLDVSLVARGVAKPGESAFEHIDSLLVVTDVVSI